MSIPRLTIRHIVFTGATVNSAALVFDDGCNIVWGASNTGKSFALKAIDFMLGGSKSLPDIPQRQGYETIWFGFTLSGAGDFTVSRAVAGGAFTLYEGLVRTTPPSQSSRLLNQIHKHEKADNLSNFLLSNLGFKGKLIATNQYGEKRALSFRDLAHILLVNETAIQADDRSPIETGQRTFKPVERSVFRLLLSGSDDSAITPVEKSKNLTASKATKLELLDEMIAEVDARLAAEYPDLDKLSYQYASLTKTLEIIQAEFDAAQGSVRFLLEEKQKLVADIPRIGERIDEIEVHLRRFDQLNGVYTSDVERLGALEEASFLVALGSERDCPLCGAGPEAQIHLQGIDDVEQIRAAVIAEINKIEMLRADLKTTVKDLEVERERLKLKFPALQERLVEVERNIGDTLPKAEEHRRTLSEILAVRDGVKAGLALREQKNGLLSKRIEAGKAKSNSKNDKPCLDLSGTLAHEFCETIAMVLTKWEFPGRLHVSFDKKNYDISVDGKLRTDNGKGVRAIMHAAFKVALLIFCHDRGLPHPGFIVLDTPLLTYRDPLRNARWGALSDDERALAQTSIKQKFFEHLFSIRNLGQFIILENIDLPENIADLAKVEIFTGEPGEKRWGFFPV